MKNPTVQSGNGEDADFDALLRSARPNALLPSTFQHTVWRRIEVAAETTTSGQITQWLSTLFGLLARPLPASAAVMVMVGAGLWLGSREAGSIDKLSYIHSVSPFVDHGTSASEP